MRLHQLQGPLNEDQMNLDLPAGSGKPPRETDKEDRYRSQQIQKKFDSDREKAAAFEPGQRVRINVRGVTPFMKKDKLGDWSPTKIYPQGGVLTGTVVEPGTLGDVVVKLDNPISYRETVRGKRVTQRLDQTEFRHWRLTPIDAGTNEADTSYEKDMDSDKPVVIHGVKGAKSTPFRKKFKNMAAYDRWSDSEEASNYEVHQVMSEGYKVLPNIDRDRYSERPGLEGPFSTLSGKVVYYDPKEGSYYDPDTDMYMTYDEFRELDNDYSGMKDERDVPIKEAKLSTEQRDRLDDLIDELRYLTMPYNDWDDFDNVEAAREVIDTIRSEFGDKIAAEIEKGSEEIWHGYRPNVRQGYDKLDNKKSTRVTKTGKANKADISALKSQFKRHRGYSKDPSRLPESDNVQESLTLDYSRYVRSHGKKPRDTGHSGVWMFTTAEYGEPGDEDMFQFQGSFADAKKAAATWAKSQGAYRFYVMETEMANGELDEADDERDELTKKLFPRMSPEEMKKRDQERNRKMNQARFMKPGKPSRSREWGAYESVNTDAEVIDEAVAKIACTKCDEVSTAKAWEKNHGFCPKCKTSSQGVAESAIAEKRNKKLYSEGTIAGTVRRVRDMIAKGASKMDVKRMFPDMSDDTVTGFFERFGISEGPAAKPANPAMKLALARIDATFSPERRAITDQISAMVRTVTMLADPRWANRAWANVEEYGITDTNSLKQEMLMMLANEKNLVKDNLLGMSAQSSVAALEKALAKL
jgi:hypothetical protein